MEITKLTSDYAKAHCDEVSKITQEELQSEFDFYIAEKIVDLMMEKGLIAGTERDIFSKENREFFHPLLKEIMA